jgi:hypothetical protein
MKKTAWYILIGLEILLLFAFGLLILGSLVDVKYQVESIESISNNIIFLFYQQIYSDSVIIVFQFLIVVYLLYKLRPPTGTSKK